MEVEILSWPKDAERREALRQHDRPRLLLVDFEQIPPDGADPLEDWARPSADEQELEIRIEVLRQRVKQQPLIVAGPAAPRVDSFGVLSYDDQQIVLSPVEAKLMKEFLAREGSVLSRAALVRMVWPHNSCTRNALDVQIGRLRRRIKPLGISIRTVRSRGYLLQYG